MFLATTKVYQWFLLIPPFEYFLLTKLWYLTMDRNATSATSKSYVPNFLPTVNVGISKILQK